MINFLLGLILLVSLPARDSVTFEGKIELVEKSYYSTTYYTYVIKNNNIRVDKFDQNHLNIQSLLVNIENQQLVVLSPSKKLFTYLKLSPSPQIRHDQFTVIKTNNIRQVNGTDCVQWRVRNEEQNTEITYWVAQNNFYFFNDFIKLLNRTEATFNFFEIIPDTQGFFPLLTVERTLLRKEKRRISVVEINPQKISDKTFTIPPDYKEVKN
ncbi:MAG: DUF4412 domain-containing protein [Bacteroidales bacterium]|jgi:hypothetical protein|nr:DUF4412 domain-containing protein [Bacteroidales bacterium]